MRKLEFKAQKLYRAINLEPPWRRAAAETVSIGPGKVDFLGATIRVDAKYYEQTEKRIAQLRDVLSHPAISEDAKIGLLIKELRREGSIKRHETRLAEATIREWLGLIGGGAVTARIEHKIRADVQAFMLTREPSLEERVFCFLLDNHFIPHSELRFSEEQNRLRALYKKYQDDPERGLRNIEKAELGRTIEFFRCLQLNNVNILYGLLETASMGLKIDHKRGKLILSGDAKKRLENNDILWRIVRVIRWIPVNDKRAIALMMILLDSPNWRDRGYAMGYLGKVAGRANKTNPELSQRIVRQVLDRKAESIEHGPSIILLEMVKVLLGDWDARQPYLRSFMADSYQAVEELSDIMRDNKIDPAVRHYALEGLKLFARMIPGGRAARRLFVMGESVTNGITAPKKKIWIRPGEQLNEHIKGRDQLLFYRGRLHPYTRRQDWKPVGATLGGGTHLAEVAIADKKWLAVRKTPQSNPKYPKQGIIPAVERITSSLGWLLGMITLSKIQLVENEEARGSYFSYAVGQTWPLTPVAYSRIIGSMIDTGEIRKGELPGRFSRQKLLQELGASDMDSPEMEQHPVIGGIIRDNRAGSTLAFLGKGDREARVWFERARQVFVNPEFLDQVKFFDWMVGNEDQLGYRNLLYARGEGEERGKLFLVDFASCFSFLQSAALDWRPTLRRFYSNMSVVAEREPSLFIEHIKPLIINFLSLSPRVINEVISEFRYGELNADEKDAIRLLLMAEKEVLAGDFVRWARLKQIQKLLK
jgi:hypothetical protein